MQMLRMLLIVSLSISLQYSAFGNAAEPVPKEQPLQDPITRQRDPAVRGPQPAASFQYPITRQGDVVDDYHGTPIADPYRWLEEPDSQETRSWIEAQNALTLGYLESIPQREPIRRRVEALWNYERYGVPSAKGGRYFFERNDGLQNQSVLYWCESFDEEPRVLLDPNTLSGDGTVALSGYRPSDDGKLLAYGLSRAGSDWQEWRVRDVATGRDLDDHLRWVKFSGANWAADGSGFYYGRYDEPPEGEAYTGANYYQKLYFHRLGTPQGDDVLIYERPDEKEWGFSGHVTDDGRYLIIGVWKGTERQNLVFYKDLQAPSSPIVELISQWQAEYSFLGNDGPTFWFHTDHQAPRYRIIAVDTAATEPLKTAELVGQSSDVLDSVQLVGNRFIATYMHDAHDLVKLFQLDGTPAGELQLPGVGSVGGFTGEPDDKETFYAFTGFTTPTTIYRYEVAENRGTVLKQPRVDFDPADYETRQVFVDSRDGTRVPMFIVHRRGLQLDGNNPTLLYGYGGFNITLSPSFSSARIAWLEMGGVYAVANLRGGGEYGRQWHESGRLKNKQNVFDDFIAAAQWLIDQRYTRSERLAIDGRSNGGLLVGACMTQRPELFGAALPGVGVMDMLRFHKFTIGWAWTSEFGSADDPAMFEVLRAYSPLHNLRPGAQYPATLITTADHDDRVVPAHSFKFAAALQAAHSGKAPVLIRIETSAGHGAGTPTAKLIEETADRYAFLAKQFGMEVPEGWAEK